MFPTVPGDVKEGEEASRQFQVMARRDIRASGPKSATRDVRFSGQFQVMSAGDVKGAGQFLVDFAGNVTGFWTVCCDDEDGRYNFWTVHCGDEGAFQFADKSEA